MQVFQDDGAPKAAPAAKAEAKSDGGSLSLPSLEFNAAFLALPSGSPPFPREHTRTHARDDSSMYVLGVGRGDHGCGYQR